MRGYERLGESFRLRVETLKNSLSSDLSSHSTYSITFAGFAQKY